MIIIQYQSFYNKSILESNGKIEALQNEISHLKRENINNREKYDEELQTLKQSNEHLKSLANDVAIPEIPDIHFTPPVPIQNTETEIDEEALKHAELRIDKLTSEKQELSQKVEQLEIDIRQNKDFVEDMKAQNQTLTANRLEISVITNELNQAHKKTLEKLKEQHRTQIQEEISKRNILESDSKTTKNKLRIHEETISTLNNKLELSVLANRRTIEHYMTLQGAFEDGHIRLNVAHKEALEDSRIRDEKHRHASEKLLQSNIEVLLKKEEYLRISEMLKIENATLKRKLEEDNEKIEKYKRVKHEMNILNDKCKKIDMECKHLRAAKIELVKEREEVRNLFMQSDRELAVLKAQCYG